MNKIAKAIVMSLPLLLVCTYRPLYGYKLKDFLEDVLKVADEILVEEEKLEQISKEVQPKKEIPKETINVNGLSIDVEYPFLEGEDFLTSASHLCGQQLDRGAIDIADLVRLTLRNTTDTQLSGVRVKTEVQGYSYPAIKTVNIPAKGSVTVKLSPIFKEDLLNLVEQRPGSVYLSIATAQGKSLYETTKRITLLSRNDMILQLHPLMGVFVTPNDRRIDELITYAAEKTKSRSMGGYQGDLQAVEGEVKAIYDTIAEFGIHYRSATFSFFDAEKYSAQRTYFPAESLETTGANCLDGSFLFASAFENIGLETAIVLVPGHAFVGVKLKKGSSKDWRFIETTMVGTNSYWDSVSAGGEHFSQNVAKKSISFLEIGDLRKMGIKPFPIAVGSKNFSLREKMHASAEKIFNIKLRSVYVSPEDFNKAGLTGQNPNLFVTIHQNKGEKISTKGHELWIVNNNALWVSYQKQNISTIDS